MELTPASLPKPGGGFDLAIAISVLAADGQVPVTGLGGIMFYAELGLDGQLRPVRGVLPAVAAAAEAGFTTVVVAAGNAAEAALVPGVRVVPADSVAEVMAWLRGGTVPPVPSFPPPSPAAQPTTDMSDITGQQDARFAAQVCAAGGHHLSLLGPAGAASKMLAERMPGILPDLDTTAALEVTAIHSMAGGLADGAGLVTRPPMAAPHPTASRAAIVGGGSGLIRPGAASLAHHGILFLDQAPEFSRDVLDALRQPLESGEVVLARSGICARFPARFTLILASRPCPCPAPAECDCSPAARRRYQARLSGPLLDRIDIKATLEPVTAAGLPPGRSGGEPSGVTAARVAAARDRAARRYRSTPWRLNAGIPGAELRRTFRPAAEALTRLEQAIETGQLSTRGAHKILRVAWTLADLAGTDRPGSDEIATAIRLWLGVSR